ncbi:MAG TPA: three-Cys-motif partner protein TcmP [Acidisarcina sp.]
MNSTKSAAEQIDEELLPLFPDLPRVEGRKPRKYKRIDQLIWSDHKARFIQHYLQYFVQITKHGTYIDGFAGPQYLDKLDAWTAALVLASEPKWLRHFYLCELAQNSAKCLRDLVGSQPIPMSKSGRRLPRKVDVVSGDFNLTIEGILASGRIAQKEATFCLLDQRTFECHWQTLVTLSQYKQPPHKKIELLYFLGVGWLHRAFSGLRNDETALKWWGRPDWRDLLDMNCWSIAEAVRRRFSDELGYKFSAAYPIFDREEGNKIMYYMIHASDHEDAPALMVRAHSKAVRSLPAETQMTLLDISKLPLSDSR